MLMESRVRSFEARRLRAAGIILQAGAQDYTANTPGGGRSPQECQEAAVDAIVRFLDGSIDREDLHDSALENLCGRCSLHRPGDLSPPAMTALGLTVLLTNPSMSLSTEKLRRGLQRMMVAAGCRRPLPVGDLLRLAAEARGRLDLSVQETPWHRKNEDVRQWADLAIESPSAGFRLIPVSVFTGSFFQEEILSRPVTEPQTDLSRYHRENDKAPRLRDLHSELSEYPRFEYYIDESGLSEIVLDTERLDWGELFLAAGIFALYSGLEDSTLEGIPVLGHR